MDEENMLEGADIDTPVEDAVEQHGEDQQEVSITIEELAAQMGHTPKEKWRGDPEKWKPAPEFLKSTADINKSLRNKVDQLADSLSRVERTSVAMAERAAAQARAKALEEHARAVEENDREAALKAAQKLNQLQEPEMAPPQEVLSFKEKHSSWFNRDEEATRVAIATAQYYADRGYSPARQLAAVERDMAKDFPEYFPQAAPRPKAPVLNTPGARAPAAKAKGFDQLPSEDLRRAALESEKRGWGTKEEWAKIYFEEQA